MKSEIMNEVISMIEAEAHSQPSGMEFELAYQTRVAIDRIRFAIKQTEQSRGQSDQLREAAMQLLDALERLESVERRFQRRSTCAVLSRKKSGGKDSNGSESREEVAKAGSNHP